MQKHTARNLALALSILAPCAQAAEDTAKPQIIVQSVRRSTLTPRDVAEGFDSRFDVTLKGWGAPVYLTAEHNSQFAQLLHQKWVPLHTLRGPRFIAWRSLIFDEATQTHKVSYLFCLSKIAPRPNPVRFEFNVGSGTLDGEGLYFSTPQTPIHFNVLEAGEKAPPLPQVSREVPISLQSAKLEKMPRGNLPEDYFRVRLHLKILRPVPAGKVSLNVVGAAQMISPDGSVRAVRNGYGYGPPQGEFIDLDYYFRRSDLPKTRQFRFQARLSMNEAWPLEIKTMLDNPSVSEGKK